MVRAKHDPTKWPILDKNGEKEEELISKLLPPPPPITKKLATHFTEDLNPDVAEFVLGEKGMRWRFFSPKSFAVIIWWL